MFPIFTKLGGEEAVLKILQTARESKTARPFPGVYALKKWKQDRRIPPINVEILQKEAEERGIEWSWSDFAANTPAKSPIPSTQESGAK